MTGDIPKSGSTDSAIEDAVSYLKESGEPFQSKVIAVTNALKGKEHSINDVLLQYADDLSVNSALYPSIIRELKELRNALNEETQHDIPKIESLCDNFTLIQTKDDVVQHAIKLYDTEVSAGERKRAIQALIKDAQKAGINIRTESVVQSLRAFADEAQDVKLGQGEQVTLATDIITPNEITAGDESVYQVKIIDGVEIESIDWYIAGSLDGTGKTLMYEFEFPGSYPVAVELTDPDGNQQYLNTEVNVEPAEEIDLSLIGEDEAEVGDSKRYLASVEAQNTALDEIEWWLDGEQIDTGRETSYTFDQKGQYTVTVVVTDNQGNNVKDSITVYVEEPTGLRINVDAPDVVHVEETASIDIDIETENSYLDILSCEIDDVPIDVQNLPSVTIEHEFVERGERKVTVEAQNDAGDTTHKTVQIGCYPEPEVTLENVPAEVIEGDRAEVYASFPDEFESNWGVSNASLVEVGPNEAEIHFNSSLTDEAEIQVEVTNGAGETARDTVGIVVHQPTIDAYITKPSEITATEPGQFSIIDSTIKHTEVDEVVWERGDGKVIGKGESITHKFPQEGEYSLTVYIEGTRNVSGSATETVEVSPKTDVTAVIVAPDDKTTAGTVELSGSKSKARNTTIGSYEWIIDNYKRSVGEVITVEFEDPGEYDITLRVESESGDVDEDTETIEIKQYTDVSARIEGPRETKLGMEVIYSAQGTQTENTTVSTYQWYINGTPAGNGEEIRQTFNKKGHHTVKLKAITSTGETDETSCGVSVSEKPAVVKPVISIVGDTVVGEDIAFTSENSTVENTEVSKYSWSINGEEVSNEPAATQSFEEYQSVTATLEMQTKDGQVKSEGKHLYVLPTEENPPYPSLTDDHTKDDVLEFAIKIDEDDDLPETEKSRFISALIDDANEHDIDVTITDVFEYLESGDYSPTVESGDDTNEEWIVSETEMNEGEAAQSDELIEFDEPEDEKDEAKYEDDNDGKQSEDKTRDEDTSHDEEQDDGRGLSVEEVQSSEKKEPEEALEEDIEVPPQEHQDPELTDKIQFDAPDEISDVHLREPNRPETYAVGENMFAMPNYAQDLVDFKYIIDEESDLAPDDVNAAGVICTREGEYVAIAEVEGRDWFINPLRVQDQIIKGYRENLLASLDNEVPVSVLCLPTSYDVEDHVRKIEQTIKKAQENVSLKNTEEDQETVRQTTSGQELILQLGRIQYPNWIESFMSDNDMKERNMYIMVQVSEDKIRKIKQGEDKGVIPQLANAPVIGGFFERFEKERGPEITRYQILRELNSRMRHVKKSLRRIDVEVERLTGRDDVMSVLYHFNNDSEPHQTSFPVGPFAESDTAALDGIDIEELMETGDFGLGMNEIDPSEEHVTSLLEEFEGEHGDLDEEYDPGHEDDQSNEELIDFNMEPRQTEDGDGQDAEEDNDHQVQENIQKFTQETSQSNGDTGTDAGEQDDVEGDRSEDPDGLQTNDESSRGESDGESSSVAEEEEDLSKFEV